MERRMLVPMDEKLLDAPKKAMLFGLAMGYNGLSEMEAVMAFTFCPV
jgi:hypothetical protein